MQPSRSRPNLPPLILARLTNPDQRRSTPQPSNRQLTSPHTPVNPQTPPSIARRLCTESPRSALDSPATSLAGGDDDEYQWTDDQIAAVIRVCNPPAQLPPKTWLTKSFLVVSPDPRGWLCWPTLALPTDPIHSPFCPREPRCQLGSCSQAHNRLATFGSLHSEETQGDVRHHYKPGSRSSIS